eukprot:9380318-Alexandrium_andersonii.AAC.1
MRGATAPQISLPRHEHPAPCAGDAFGGVQGWQRKEMLETARSCWNPLEALENAVDPRCGPS